MSRSPSKKEKLARKSTDRANGMRRKREDDERGNGSSDNKTEGGEIQENNNPKKEGIGCD